MGNLLRTNENWHRSLISKMGNGFALTEIIFDRDKKPADCLFLDVNPAFEKMTAVNAIDLVAKKVGIVFPGTESFWVDQCGQVALTGISLQFKNYAKLLGRHFEVIACSLGKGLVATFFSDITERMRIEEAYH
ncbi:MAG: hypothetical protein P8X68_16370, partial [Desulfobacterales bacterium]